MNYVVYYSDVNRQGATHYILSIYSSFYNEIEIQRIEVSKEDDALKEKLRKEGMTILQHFRYFKNNLFQRGILI